MMEKYLRMLKTFGKTIRLRRHEIGLTQLELAERVDCSLKHLGNVERGQCNTSLIMNYKIAEALQTDARDLLP
jgi:transcriptional regulator with XRE-family HTH domain